MPQPNNKPLSNEDKDTIYLALNYWANYVETGDMSMSAIDAQNQKKKVKALSFEQMQRIVQLRELATKVQRLKK